MLHLTIQIILAQAFMEKPGNQINIRNKKASFAYQFLDTYIAGMVLSGTEIKSIRLNNVSMGDAYCYFMNGEMYVKSLHISKYSHGTYLNHEPMQERKLLLKKKELRKIENKLDEQGLTLIPVRLFVTERGWAKLEIAVAKGKKLHDKRDDIKDRDAKRELDRNYKM
jgi:SsrA-binding protein